MDGRFVFAVVLSVVVIVVLVLRAVRVHRASIRLRAAGQQLPRAVLVFWILAGVAIVLVVGAWTFVLAT